MGRHEQAVGSQPTSCPYYRDRLTGPNGGNVSQPAQGYPGRTGEQGGGFRLDTVRDRRQRGCRKADELGEPPVNRVSHPTALDTSVVVSGSTAAAARAEGRERGYYPIADRERRDRASDVHDPAAYLVAEDDVRLDAPAEDPAHHGNVVVAQAAGGDLDQCVSGARRRRFDLSDGE